MAMYTHRVFVFVILGAFAERPSRFLGSKTNVTEKLNATTGRSLQDLPSACLTIACPSGTQLVGDINGCGGRCEPCAKILCSPGTVLVGDINGCGGRCELCFQILCSPGQQLVGDINGCFGRCECAQILCSPGTQLVGDINGCGGKCEPCAQILCSPGTQLVGDINGCGGRCMASPPTANFEELSGFCRTAKGDKGDFKKVSATRAKCRSLCRADPSCVAFEHEPEMACELHRAHISTIKPADGPGTVCEVKRSSKNAFDTLSGHCRTKNGGKGTFRSVETVLPKCEILCATDPKCVAFEYSPGRKCELHEETVTTVKPDDTVTCRVKLM